MRLKNKIALVTGAAQGIGLAIAEAFAKEGARVFLADIDVGLASQEATRLTAEGLLAEGIRCDVGSTREVEEAIRNILLLAGRLDILVNNAAVAIGGNITEMPESAWDELMNVNLKSVFRTTRAALPGMISQGSGSVINISSVQAFRSWDDWTAYAAAKGAILSMTNQLAGQFGAHRVRFNTISPGAILTPMNERRAEKEGDNFIIKSAAMHALRRMGRPEEVAAAAVFLAADESGFVTGADIRVDGGLCTLPGHTE